MELFNRMVDSLEQRFDRELRLFGDVGHELRTPPNTRTTSPDVLNRSEEDSPPRMRQALELVTAEVYDPLGLLDDPMALARVEAGLDQGGVDQLSVRELLVHTLRGSRHPAVLLNVNDDVTVFGRKPELERAVVNLWENAYQHGAGVVPVTVLRYCDEAAIAADDAPGVLPDDRERVFERATKTAITHRGRVGCAERPGCSSARTIRLLVVEREGRHRPVTRP